MNATKAAAYAVDAATNAANAITKAKINRKMRSMIKKLEEIK